jgi:TRAP transporter TAXI family solute receptor
VISRRAVLLGLGALAVGCGRQLPGGAVTIAAGEEGGLYLAFAELIAERVRTRYAELRVDVLRTEGSIDNLARLRAGRCDLALALADVTEQDRASRPDDAPVAVARVYENYLQLVVPATSPVRRLADLRGRRISIGARGSGAAATSQVLLEVAGLDGQVQVLRLGLQDALAGLASGTVDAVVWSGGVPTPAIAEMDADLPLRLLDLGAQAAPMAAGSGYPYVARGVPAGGYVPRDRRTIGVPDLLLCRPETDKDVVAALVDVLATDAAHLVPPYVRGLQYLDPPAMIQTGRVPLHPGAVRAYRDLHG